MKAIQQQSVEAKKNEGSDALKEVKRLCKGLGFAFDMLISYLEKERGEK